MIDDQPRSRSRRDVIASMGAVGIVGLAGCTSFQSATGLGDSSGSGETTATGTPGGSDWTNEGLETATSEAESLSNGIRISMTIRSTDDFNQIRATGYAYDSSNTLLGSRQKMFSDVGQETIDVTLDITGFDSYYVNTFDTDLVGKPAGFIDSLF